MTLFDMPPEPPPPPLSADRKRTIRQKAMIASGRNPATGMRLRDPAGETCGTCDHLVTRYFEHKRRYFKCELVTETRGPGSDIRLSWPACSQWQPSTIPSPPSDTAEPNRTPG